MFRKLIPAALSKAQMSNFLGHTPKANILKAQLLEELLLRIETVVNERTRLLATFPYELAVGPTELEELLQCSKVERKRWVKEGKLPVLTYRSFRKAGHDLQYPVHDRCVILAISQDEIAFWREEYQAQVQEHRRLGVQLALERKKVNQYARQQFLASWQETVALWTERSSPELAAVLELSYWTGWASRWAKENHSKAVHGTKHAMHYAEQRDTWYKRKNEAMHVLFHTPYAKFSFYRPEDPDKMILQLCEEHYEEKIEGFYEDKWDFYTVHKSTIHACPHCFVHIERDYYALYYLEIATTAIPDVHFSFHMPYPIGKSLFPSPKNLPKVQHIEQDGLFRFGRTLYPFEKITHREADVRTHFEQALLAVKQLYIVGQVYNYVDRSEEHSR